MGKQRLTLVLIIDAFFSIFQSVVLWVAGAFLAAGCASASLKAVSDGHNRISDFFVYGFRYFRKMIGFMFLAGLTYLIPVAMFLTSFWLLLQKKIFWGVFLLLPSVLLLTALSMAILHAPLIVIHENVRVRQAMPLSFRLFRKRFGSVFLSALFTLPAYLLFAGATGLWVLSGMLSAMDPYSGGPLFFLLFLIGPFLFTVGPGALLLAPSTLLLSYRYLKVLRPSLALDGGASEDSSNEEIFGLRKSFEGK